MQIQQFVMAYSVEQDRIRAMLPDGIVSLRPVLRINAEIHDGQKGYAELNTAVEKDGIRGWLNVGYWDNIPFRQTGSTVTFFNDILEISFTGTGIQGGCPAEKDNGGCFFGNTLRLPETVASGKEFCDCKFTWKISGGTSGRSIGKTLPAFPTPPTQHYPKQSFTVQTAAVIPCKQVLGTYFVEFQRLGETKEEI